MTRLARIAAAYIAGDMESAGTALAFMPRPATLAAPHIVGGESDVAGGRMVLRFADPVAGFCLRAHIRAGFDGRAIVRVTGRNKYGARDWLAERLPGILDAACTGSADAAPPDLPPDLA